MSPSVGCAFQVKNASVSPLWLNGKQNSKLCLQIKSTSMYEGLNTVSPPSRSKSKKREAQMKYQRATCQGQGQAMGAMEAKRSIAQSPFGRAEENGEVSRGANVRAKLYKCRVGRERPAGLSHRRAHWSKECRQCGMLNADGHNTVRC